MTPRHGHDDEVMAVRIGEIVLDSKRLETGWWGSAPDAAPTLVLLHEGLGCVALWRNFPAALVAATGCGVFAWSRFGYGASDPVPLPRPMTYMHHEALKVVPRVLDAAGIRGADRAFRRWPDRGDSCRGCAGRTRSRGGADRGALLRRGYQHRQHRRDQG